MVNAQSQKQSITSLAPQRSPATEQTGLLQRKCTCGGSPGMDGECAECRAKRLSRQRGAISPAASSKAVPPIVHDVLGSPGHSLDAGTRTYMEPRFGHNFSNVRVHTDAKAAESARAVNALAYTVGRDVVFGTGQYAPGTKVGMKLMAHEVTHVVQQQQMPGRSGLQGKLELGRPEDIYEQQAEAQVAKVIEGHTADIAPIKGASDITTLRRKVDEEKLLTGSGCEVPTSSPAGPLSGQIPFNFDSDDIAKGKAEISGFVRSAGGASALKSVRVDGYASKEGDPGYNLGLSCRRAIAVKKELVSIYGISESAIDTFAHGPTSIFNKKVLADNRIVLITAFVGPSPTPPKPDCPTPGVSRTVELQPIFFKSSNTDRSPTGKSWSRRLSKSRSIWGKLGVRFIEKPPIILVDPHKTAGNNLTETDEVRKLHSGPGVEVFLVDNDMSYTQAGGAFTFFPLGPDAKTVLSDRGTSDTLLAHELGHVLGLNHPGDGTPNDGDTNSIMVGSGSNSTPNPTRNTIVNFSRMTWTPEASTCISPDP